MSKPTPDEAEQVHKFIEQQKGYVTQTEERFKVRAQQAKQKQQEAMAAAQKEEGEEKQQEEEEIDEDNKVDVELVQFEREYARVLKEFEAMEKNAKDE